MKWYQDIGKTINWYGITIGNLGEWYIVNWICVVYECMYITWLYIGTCL